MVEFPQAGLARGMLRALREGVGNVLWYAGEVWLDRWWDYAFLLRLMGRKLTRMADKFERHAFSEGAEGSAARMREAARLCAELASDDDDAEDKLARLCGILNAHLLEWWD